jgi:hypothetical protein
MWVPSPTTNAGSQDTLIAEATVNLSMASAWSDSTNLGMTVNSSGSDQHPAISANGLSLYITSNRSGSFGGDDIWVSKRTSIQDPWGPPVNLGPVINTSSNDRVPTFSRDGRLMFFGSNRPSGQGGLDLYVSSRPDPNDDFGWTAPVNIGPVINTAADEDGATYFENVVTGLTTLYFTSNRPGGLGDFDIYLSRQNADGSFSPPTLITELSTPQRDTRTTIRRDGLEIFITSDRPGSVGLLDVWVSTRATAFDLWSPPVNPGPSINTTANDGAPALSADGATFYFYSNRPGGVGGNDLYVTTRTVN